MDSFTLKKVEFDAVRHILSRFCATSLGKHLAVRISPSRNPELIQRWLEQTTQMVQALRDVGVAPFGGVTDIREALGRARPGGGASAEDFAVIASTLEGAGHVRAYLQALPEGLGHLHELAAAMTSFEGEVKAIREVVGPDAEVMDTASPRLASLRREIEGLTQRIREVIYGYARDPEVAKLLQNPAVTLHGDRYVLPVRSENRRRLPGVVHRASQTGATVFVEPTASVELNNRLADLMEDERNEVLRLLSELAVRIGRRYAEIEAALRTLAQVDLLGAKAQYAYQFDMVCPAVSEHGPLELPQARHPLLIEQAYQDEQAQLPPDRRHRVVPIDLRLGSDFDLLVITGSNTGGKTVTLKTAALLAMMTQSGLHIPARRGATLPAFHDVFVDVGDEQSLQQSLSTFGAHIRRLRYILQKADKSSLVLLDELGAGTDPDEGAAIGQAVLDELCRIGCLGMVTTHLGMLKAYALNHQRVENASVEFDVPTMSPTYHLRIGTPGESHAIAVASRLGLDKRLVAAARQYLGSRDRQLRAALKATGTVRQQAESARSAAQQVQLEAQTQLETYEAKLADLHRLQGEFETWLAMIPELKSGDEVFVPSLNKTGRLARLELDQQRALVDVGAVQVEVPLKELVPNLGQEGVRRQINQLRQSLLEQAGLAEQSRAQAQRLQEEYRRSLDQQKQRAREFDLWLNALARVKVGDEAPIARKPGHGTVVSVDFPALRARVRTPKGEEDIPLQDLFPQSGPFAPSAQRQRPPRPRRNLPPEKRPMERGKTQPTESQQLLALQPGQKVFVVPFRKSATLIRLNLERQQATVQAGAFEMDLPLSDLEPMPPG